MLETGEFPQAFPTLPLRISVAGTVTHVPTHDLCISMSFCWCCHLHTDITKRTIPYGGIAALGTVKYRSDMNCTSKAIFLVFRMTRQADFSKTLGFYQGIKTRTRFSSFQLAATCTGTLTIRFFRRYFSQKYYDLLIMLICYDKEC